MYIDLNVVSMFAEDLRNRFYFYMADRRRELH